MDFKKRTDAKRIKTGAVNDNGFAPDGAKDSEDQIDPRILSLATLLGRVAAQECLAEAANDNEPDS